MVKVAKFGGSSCASSEQFKKVKDIVLSDRDRKYIIVSAPGKRNSKDTKVTDLFLSLYEAVQEKKDGAEGKKSADGKVEKLLEKIQKRYQEILDGLSLSLSLETEFQEIVKRLLSGASRDYAASRGEFLNAKVMAEYLGFPFIDAEKLIFFSEEGCDFKKTEEVSKELLSAVDYAVIPGFYGVNDKGEVITFSRGGSDVTGSLIAAAVYADLYENWTDVSGFLVADPHIVSNPEVIDYITYKELRELSYMGAGVLHEDAIFPVRKEGIPIQILNTNSPQDHGTMIVANTLKKPRFIITGIAGKKHFCSINIEKAMMNSEIGFIRKVLSVIEENGISVEHTPSGIDTLTLFIHQEELESHEQKVLQGIQRAVTPDLIELESDLALIAVVGRGMKSSRGVAGRIFSALAHEYINIKMIDQGSSEYNIIIGVKNENFEAAIRAIYNMFVLSVSPAKQEKGEKLG